MLSQASEMKPASTPDEVEAIPTSKVLADEKKALRGSPDHPLKGGQEDGMFGLAFSGGGIRSATFNLGVLQGLAEMSLLRRIDYLSTVSGGGYIGGWLQARIYRRYFERRIEALERARYQARPPSPAAGEWSPDLLMRLAKLEVQAARYPQAHRIRANLSVTQRLATLEGAHDAQGASKIRDEVITSVEDELARRSPSQLGEDYAVRFLREYSNYLTPNAGALTADTWTAVVVYLRNLLLNLSVLVPALVALLLCVHALVGFHEFIAASPKWVLFFTSVFASATQGLIFWALYRSDVVSKKQHKPFRSVYWYIVISALAATFTASALFHSPHPLSVLTFQEPGEDTWQPYLMAGLISLVYGVIWGFGAGRSPARGIGPRDHKLTGRGVGIAAGIAALGALAAFDAVPGLAHSWLPQYEFALSIFGAPIVLTLLAAAVGAQIGLAGRGMSEYMREWASRLAALLVLWALGLGTLFGLVMYGPALREFLVRHLNHWVHTLTLGWLLTTAGGIWAARSSDDPGPRRRLLIGAAPHVFALGAVILLAGATQDLIKWLAGQGILQSAGGTLTPVACLVLAVALGGLAGMLSWRVGVNEFSMHALYRNRLVRCYLGSVRQNDRHADSFTGFDVDDDAVLIDQLCSDKSKDVLRPFPIFNATLNLVVGQRLAWQFRRASSFVFTPLFSGYEPRAPSANAPENSKLSANGYRPSERFGGGISFGTAMAISGAAVSPNMGARTSPSMAFLMTLLNVRLGWWLGNPRHAKTWNHSGPKLGLAHLLLELLGKASDSREYVYLSDGGHFENLGVYELVRRRCRYIVACDAGQDSDYQFADLGNAIEKCRVDFGVEIEVDLSPFARDEKTGFARSHCAVGTIHYPKNEATAAGGEVGIFVYVKTALTGCEPRDLLTYARQNTSFPNDTTVDQWFDEVQFESYRVLGKHTIRSVFEGVMASREEPAQDGDEHGNEHLFMALRQRFLPRSPFNEAAFSKHASELIRLHELVRNSPALGFLDAQLFPEWTALQRSVGFKPGESGEQATRVWLPDQADELRGGFYFCLQLIQLMENVYLDLRLDETHEHPDNRGWMNLFHRWSWSGMFRTTWAVCASTMGTRFQSFCERRLGLTVGDAAGVQLTFYRHDQRPSRLAELGDDCANELDLNFRERSLLREIAKQHLAQAEQAIWRCFAARLEVRDEASPCNESRVVSFTVGFGILQEPESGSRKLVYLRIQDHLRRTGLARRVVDALWRPGPLNCLDLTQNMRLSEAISSEDLARIVRSVQEVRPSQVPLAAE